MKPLPAALAALLGACIVMAPALPAPPMASYAAAGTAVAKNAGQSPVLDTGGVVCSALGPDLGGGCIDFGPFDSVRVHDDALGAGVAFQVCIDNNGDSLCRVDPRDRCGDDIFFSHDDKGAFFNPLGPLPKGFRPDCPGGPFQGYVVFLCAGVHNAGTPHAHAATTGAVLPATGGTGYGDFCQAGAGGGQGFNADPGKRYRVL